MLGAAGEVPVADVRHGHPAVHRETRPHPRGREAVLRPTRGVEVVGHAEVHRQRDHQPDEVRAEEERLQLDDRHPPALGAVVSETARGVFEQGRVPRRLLRVMPPRMFRAEDLVARREPEQRHLCVGLLTQGQSTRSRSRSRRSAV